MNELRAVDSLDLFAKRWAIVHESRVNNLVGRLLTFIESITPDGDQQGARKQIVKKIIYSNLNEMLILFRDSIDDLRKFYEYVDGTPEHDWYANSREN